MFLKGFCGVFSFIFVLKVPAYFLMQQGPFWHSIYSLIWLKMYSLTVVYENFIMHLTHVETGANDLKSLCLHLCALCVCYWPFVLSVTLLKTH
jgi:hypothetical protein